MKKCLKSKMAVVLLSLLLILGCVFVLVYPKSNQHKKTESASKYVESGNIKDVSYWGDNKEYILAKDFYFVGNRYLVLYGYAIMSQRIQKNHMNYFMIWIIINLLIPKI